MVPRNRLALALLVLASAVAAAASAIDARALSSDAPSCLNFYPTNRSAEAPATSVAEDANVLLAVWASVDEPNIEAMLFDATTFTPLLDSPVVLDDDAVDASGPRVSYNGDSFAVVYSKTPLSGAGVFIVTVTVDGSVMDAPTLLTRSMTGPSPVAPATSPDVLDTWSNFFESHADVRALSVPERTRIRALFYLAIFEAVNSISKTYEPYNEFVDTGIVDADMALADAAVASAANAVVAALMPASVTAPSVASDAANLLATQQGIYAGEPGVTAGEALGDAASTLVLAATDYAADVAAAAATIYTAPSSPTAYPDAGNELFPGWATIIAPFSDLTPPEILRTLPDGPTQAQDLAEVTSYTSAAITADGAKKSIVDNWAMAASTYHVDTVWALLAQELASDPAQAFGVVDKARAHLRNAIALSDAITATWANAYTAAFWRPVQAEPTFVGYSDLVVEFPGFVSHYAALSFASAKTLEDMFGDAFTVTPPVGAYTSLAAMAEDAAMSTVYGGLNFPSDKTEGQTVGVVVAAHVSELFAPRVFAVSAPDVAVGADGQLLVAFGGTDNSQFGCVLFSKVVADLAADAADAPSCLVSRMQLETQLTRTALEAPIEPVVAFVPARDEFVVLFSGVNLGGVFAIRVDAATGAAIGTDPSSLDDGLAAEFTIAVANDEVLAAWTTELVSGSAASDFIISAAALEVAADTDTVVVKGVVSDVTATTDGAAAPSLAATDAGDFVLCYTATNVNGVDMAAQVVCSAVTSFPIEVSESVRVSVTEDAETAPDNEATGPAVTVTAGGTFVLWSETIGMESPSLGGAVVETDTLEARTGEFCNLGYSAIGAAAAPYEVNKTVALAVAIPVGSAVIAGLVAIAVIGRKRRIRREQAEANADGEKPNADSEKNKDEAGTDTDAEYEYYEYE